MNFQWHININVLERRQHIFDWFFIFCCASFAQKSSDNLLCVIPGILFYGTQNSIKTCFFNKLPNVWTIDYAWKNKCYGLLISSLQIQFNFDLPCINFALEMPGKIFFKRLSTSSSLATVFDLWRSVFLLVFYNCFYLSTCVFDIDCPCSVCSSCIKNTYVLCIHIVSHIT